MKTGLLISGSRKALMVFLASASLMVAPGCVAQMESEDESLNEEEEPIAEAAEAIVWNYHDYLFFLAPLNWEQAQGQCALLGYSLVTIDNSAEENWLATKEAAYGGGVWWIGYNDKGFENIWGWAAPPTASYTNWAPGEPNNYQNNEDCAVDNWNAGRWNDYPCTITAKYICERNY